MKTLEELDVSPTPWREASYGLIVSSNNKKVADFCGSGYDPKGPDFIMMKCAPRMYDALQNAIVDLCDSCKYSEDAGWRCAKKEGDCHVQRYRAALAEASGDVNADS